MRMAVLALAVSAAWGQGGIEGVRSGVLFDPPSGSIRILEGIPGSAHLGGALTEGLEAAWISPSGRAALARRGGTWVALRGLGQELPDVAELGGEVERVQWSADGRRAAVALADGQAAVWDAEDMNWRLKVEVAGTGELSGVGVTDEGLLLAGRFDGDSTCMAGWQDQAWREMGCVAGRGLIASAGSRIVLAGAGEIAAFDGWDEAWRIPTGRGDGPVGVAVAGGMIAAAFGGESPELVFWTLEGVEAERLALELAPNRLEPLPGGGGLVLRQRERDGDEIWVAARRSGRWVAYFVPAGE